MRILVIGGGAREDALSWALSRSPSCEALFHAPGNAGTALRGDNWEIAATDGKMLAEQARSAGIDLAVIGPETAIAAGVGDRLRDAGIAVFGPNRSGGRLESSKVFAKRFMERHGVPTARAEVAHSLERANAILDEWDGPVVLKADGLAAGKGVVVAPDVAAARAVVSDWYGNRRIPGGGSDILLEECLEGRELSLFALADGRAMIPFAAACDYKRAGEGDRGPNTGGMGAYSPPHGFPDDLLDRVRERILAPVLRGLLAEGEEYVGVLYCGLMWTADGPYVIEFNARFGDPETQSIMPRVRGDFAALLHSVASGAADPSLATIAETHSVAVVLATEGYPAASTPLHGLPADLPLPEGSVAFWGASRRIGDRVDAGGGRVLTVAAEGPDLAEARRRAYGAIEALREPLARFPLSYRRDIAAF
jgi:phosphoribosylamine--glycine ligase